MMRLICVGLCVASTFVSTGRAAQPQPVAPSEVVILKAAALPPNVQGDISIVKEPLGRGQWKCSVYYTAVEPVRIPWGWVPVLTPRVREVIVESPRPKA